MTRGRWLAVALAAAAVLLVARVVAVAYVEYRWFAAFGAGALGVWRARAVDLTVLRSVAALVAAGFLYLNLLGVASTIDAVAVSRRLGGIEIAETVPAGRLRGLFVLVSLAFGIAMALPITEWVAFDAILTGHAFQEIEPYTGRDLSFFVYWLPFENGVYAWTLVMIAFVTGAVVALYALTPGLRWSRGRVRASVRVRRHLALFGVATLLLLAWGHRLDGYGLLIDGSGANGAFSGTDELAVLPTRFALAFASALAAIVVLRAGWAGQARLAFWAVTAVVLATVLGPQSGGPDRDGLGRADTARECRRSCGGQSGAVYPPRVSLRTACARPAAIPFGAGEARRTQRTSYPHFRVRRARFSRTLRCGTPERWRGSRVHRATPSRRRVGDARSSGGKSSTTRSRRSSRFRTGSHWPGHPHLPQGLAGRGGGPRLSTRVYPRRLYRSLASGARRRRCSMCAG